MILAAPTQNQGILAIVLSALGALLVFVLVRIAIRLASSAELSVRIKRFPSLLSGKLKLSVLFQNENRGNEFSVGGIYVESKEGLKEIAPLAIAPLVIRSNGGKMTFENGMAHFVLNSHGAIEVMMDFSVPFAMLEQSYLYFLDRRGKAKKIKIGFSSSEGQWVHPTKFRKAVKS